MLSFLVELNVCSVYTPCCKNSSFLLIIHCCRECPQAWTQKYPSVTHELGLMKKIQDVELLIIGSSEARLLWNCHTTKLSPLHRPNFPPSLKVNWNATMLREIQKKFTHVR